MVRKAIESKNNNRKKFLEVSQQAQKRLELRAARRAVMADTKLSDHEKIIKNYGITKQLDRLKRDSSECRVRNMCGVCGRPRFYIRSMGQCRICIRHYAKDIIGLKKGE